MSLSQWSLGSLLILAGAIGTNAAAPSYWNVPDLPPENPNRGLVGEAGIVLGVGGPYAYGVEGAWYPVARLNLNGGFGASPVGFKFGGGLKLFFRPEETLSPFAGVNYSFNTGTPTLTAGSESGDRVRFRATPGQTLVPRAGVRYALKRFFNFYGTVGYGFLMNGGTVLVREGSRSEVPYLLFEPDGLEISLGASWKLQKGQSLPW